MFFPSSPSPPPQKRRLTELTTVARETSAALQQHSDVAERVLGLSERARMLETEKEKVTPFALTAEAAAEVDETVEGMSSAPLEGFDVSEEEMGKLVGFHRRYNRALLDKLTMTRERERLVQENMELQSVLKQVRAFCAGPLPWC